MTGTQLRSHLWTACKRCGGFLSETFTLSAEAGLYPDPLHLGPVLAVLYSSEARLERRRVEAADAEDAHDAR